MAKPGPARTPSAVAKLRGNPGHRALDDLQDDIETEVMIPECPSILGARGKKEWRRVTQHLFRLGVLSELDVGPLILYCQAMETYDRMLRRIRKARCIDQQTGKELRGEEAYYYESPLAILVRDQRRYPEARAFKEAKATIVQMASQFGFTPSARSGMIVKKPEEKPKGRTIHDVINAAK